MAKKVSYVKTKADIQSENKELQDTVKRLEAQLRKLKQDTEAIKGEFGTFKAEKTPEVEKRFITAEEFQARSINPGNLRRKIDRAEWPPDIKQAILDKAL